MTEDYEQKVERLAAHCHDEQWSGWMKYVFRKSESHEDGSVTIPAEFVDRWLHQIRCPYSELPEDMKESDRNEAQKILTLLERR